MCSCVSCARELWLWLLWVPHIPTFTFHFPTHTRQHAYVPHATVQSTFSVSVLVLVLAFSVHVHSALSVQRSGSHPHPQVPSPIPAPQSPSLPTTQPQPPAPSTSAGRRLPPSRQPPARPPRSVLRAPQSRTHLRGMAHVGRTSSSNCQFRRGKTLCRTRAVRSCAVR